MLFFINEADTFFFMEECHHDSLFFILFGGKAKAQTAIPSTLK